MTDFAAQPGVPARKDDPGSTGFRGRVRTVPMRGLALYGLAMVEIVLSVLEIVAITLFVCGVGMYFLPPVNNLVRKTISYRRQLVGRWTGKEIADPYPPEPVFGRDVTGRIENCMWILRSQATWRDLLWLILDPVIGAPLALIPAALLFYGVEGVLLAFLWTPLTRIGYQDWYTFVHVHGQAPAWQWVLIPLGLAIGLLGAYVGPWFLQVHAAWTRALLAPTPATEAARLAQRVRHLTETRTDAVDTQAAELRRIERDLHDGAQARLVAMGMNLGAIEELLEKNPVAARALVVETRDASARALTELRALVRRIHPPVLADRGLGDAVRALALDSALTWLWLTCGCRRRSPTRGCARRSRPAERCPACRSWCSRSTSSSSTLASCLPTARARSAICSRIGCSTAASSSTRCAGSRRAAPRWTRR